MVPGWIWLVQPSQNLIYMDAMHISVLWAVCRILSWFLEIELIIGVKGMPAQMEPWELVYLLCWWFEKQKQVKKPSTNYTTKWNLFYEARFSVIFISWFLHAFLLSGNRNPSKAGALWSIPVSWSLPSCRYWVSRVDTIKDFLYFVFEHIPLFGRLAIR